MPTLRRKRSMRKSMRKAALACTLLVCTTIALTHKSRLNRFATSSLIQAGENESASHEGKSLDDLIRKSHMVSWRARVYDAATKLALQEAPMAFDGCTWEGMSCTWPAEAVAIQRWDGASVANHANLGICGIKGHRESDTITPEASPTDDRMYVPLDVPQGAYYPHFVDGVMPKLVYALIQRKDEQGVLVYIPPGYKSRDTETLLAQMNVELTHQPASTAFATVIWACNTPQLTPAQAEYLRDMLRGENWYARHPPPTLPIRGTRAPRLVWLSRNSPTVRNGRKLPNEDECLQAIRSLKWDITIIVGEETLAERQTAISNADLLVGEHGGAFYHLLWLPPHASVIELHGTRRYSIIWTLAQSLGHPYYRVDREHGTNADINELRRVLMLALPA